jgi:hypothetical protein
LIAGWRFRRWCHIIFSELIFITLFFADCHYMILLRHYAIDAFIFITLSVIDYFHLLAIDDYWCHYAFIITLPFSLPHYATPPILTFHCHFHIIFHVFIYFSRHYFSMMIIDDAISLLRYHYFHHYYFHHYFDAIDTLSLFIYAISTFDFDVSISRRADMASFH